MTVLVKPHVRHFICLEREKMTLRMCGLHRWVSNCILKKKIPLDHIDDLFDYLHWAQVFPKVNLRNEYHHICANVSNFLR
jgi:hypothetical protein